MELPTKQQVAAVTTNAVAFAALIVGLFGLAGKVDMNQVTEAIKALGTVATDIITAVGLISPFVALARTWWKTTRAQQVQSVAAVPGTTVVLPSQESPLAKSIPGPSVVSATDVKVVSQ